MSKSDSQTSKDLRPIQALRFLTMFCVVIGHCVLFINVMPVYNPQFMEKNFYRVVTMILVNGTTIIQTFFGISGYLLSVQFAQLQEKSSFCFKHFWTAIVYRYVRWGSKYFMVGRSKSTNRKQILRLTPVYLFVILLHSTWLVRLQDGPLWPHLMETERTFCRKNWWANLFYINNIFTTTEPVCIRFRMFLDLWCSLRFRL